MLPSGQAEIKAFKEAPLAAVAEVTGTEGREQGGYQFRTNFDQTDWEKQIY